MSRGAGQVPLAVTQGALLERLAAGLGITEDIEEAARLVGLGKPDNLPELARLAREKHADMVEGRATVAAKILHQGLILSALQTRDGMPQMTASQSAAAAKAITQAIDLLTGGTQRVYSQIVLELHDGAAE